MKIRTFTLLLILTLLFTGCSVLGVSRSPDAVAPASNQDTTGITREQAQAIALEHAGFTADQVTRLRTEYEIDDGIPRYEVQFQQGRWEYDYEINANTGDILSYDRDD